MQNRIIVSTVPVSTSVAKPLDMSLVAIKLTRNDLVEGVHGIIEAFEITDNTDVRNPEIGYRIVTPNPMTKMVSYTDLISLESTVTIPPSITSVNERREYLI